MTSRRAPRPIHVERTADSTVLRWVAHHPRLDGAPPGRRQTPPHSPLGQLRAGGSITDISVHNGDVLVSTCDPGAWPQLAPRVQAALLEELDRLDTLHQATSHWLLEAVGVSDRTPSITEVQQIVDRAAGSVMTSHGGTMTVVAIDRGTAHLRSAGACNGCRQSDDTIVGLISPALRAAFPEIASVVVDAAPSTTFDRPAAGVARRVGLRTRLRRGHIDSCH